MQPITLLGPQKVVDLLSANDALQMTVQESAAQAGILLPSITTSQIVVTSLTPDLADKNAQMTYPRVCIHSTQVNNTHREKFRSFSGSVMVVLDVWFSSSLLGPTGTGLHYYVEAIASILQANTGDWGDSFYYSGLYEVQLQTPRAGGFGFLESARMTCLLDVNYS